MKTQTITVEIKAEVPVGKYCYDFENNIECREWIHEHSRFNPIEHDTCLVHRWVKLESKETDYDLRTHVLKCSAWMLAPMAFKRA